MNHIWWFFFYNKILWFLSIIWCVQKNNNNMCTSTQVEVHAKGTKATVNIYPSQDNKMTRKRITSLQSPCDTVKHVPSIVLSHQAMLSNLWEWLKLAFRKQFLKSMLLWMLYIDYNCQWWFDKRQKTCGT